MNTALIIFALCTFANVIISTIKGLVTIKGGKLNAAFWNALGYGLYAYIVVLTANAPISTVAKIAITVICNLIGVYGVKAFEAKMRKDKLWKWEVTIHTSNNQTMIHDLGKNAIPHSYVVLNNKHTVFNIYADTQKESKIVKDLVKKYNGKSFASETKLI